MAKVSVIGAGSWGTALALLLYKNGHDVTVWSYQEEEVRMLSEKREHVSKLPGVKIPEGIFFTADIKEAVEEHRERQKGRKFAEFLMNQWNSLTEAERQVADMVAKGLTNNMISLVLEITERTVRSHRSSIYEKLEVENAAELSGFLNDLNRYRKAYLLNNPNQ